MDKLPEQFEVNTCLLNKGTYNFTDMQKRIIRLEVAVENMSNAVSEMTMKMDIFMTKIRDINSSFIRWIIGTVLLSFMFGLFFQYQAFKEIHKDISNVEKKVLQLKKENSQIRRDEWK